MWTNRAHDLLPSGRAGDRAGAGIVLARLGVGVTAWGVAEFGQHPGTKYRTHPGLGQDDLSVRVPAKMLLDLPLHNLDLLVEQRRITADEVPEVDLRLRARLVSGLRIQAEYGQLPQVVGVVGRVCLSGRCQDQRYRVGGDCRDGDVHCMLSRCGAPGLDLVVEVVRLQSFPTSRHSSTIGEGTGSLLSSSSAPPVKNTVPERTPRPRHLWAERVPNRGGFAVQRIVLQPASSSHQMLTAA